MGRDIKKNSKFYANYTFNTYRDLAISIPLGITKKFWDVYDALKDDSSTVTRSSWEDIKEYTPFYNKRNKLRDKFNTEPGVNYLENRAYASIPFFLVGAPAAYFGENIIENYSPELSEGVKNSLISFWTSTVQLIANYTTFMINEVNSNRYKYVNNSNKLNIKKINNGLGKALKTFLPVDITYVASKMIGQNHLMNSGDSGFIASAYFDLFAVPVICAAAVPLGLKYKLIDIDHSENQPGGLERDILVDDSHKELNN